MGAQEMMMDAAVQTSINMTAKMFGISPDAVTKILKAGLPAMGQAMQENPEAMKQMFIVSYKMMPEDMQEYYKKMAEDPAFQEASAEQYQQVFGEMTESINRIAAEGGGVDEATAAKVMSATLPATAQAATVDAPEGEDESGFGHRVKGLFS